MTSALWHGIAPGYYRESRDGFDSSFKRDNRAEQLADVTPPLDPASRLRHRWILHLSGSTLPPSHTTILPTPTRTNHVPSENHLRSLRLDLCPTHAQLPRERFHLVEIQGLHQSLACDGVVWACDDFRNGGVFESGREEVVGEDE